MPQPNKTKPKAINQNATAALLETLEGDWKWSIAVVGFGGGLRRGEILGLRMKDHNPATGKLTIAGQIVEYQDGTMEWTPAKTEAGERVVTLPPEVNEVLNTARAELAERRMALGLGRSADAYIFSPDAGTTPYSPDKLTRSFSAHCDSHGLPEFTFHGTRHTHLTDLLRKVGKTGAKAVADRAGPRT